MCAANLSCKILHAIALLVLDQDGLSFRNEKVALMTADNACKVKC